MPEHEEERPVSMSEQENQEVVPVQEQPKIENQP